MSVHLNKPARGGRPLPLDSKAHTRGMAALSSSRSDPETQSVPEIPTPLEIIESRTGRKKTGEGKTENGENQKPPKKPRRGPQKPSRGIQVVEVHWEDAVSVGATEWLDEEDIDLDSAPSLALGYLVAETDDNITIVALVNEMHYAHGITIPKGCITKIVTIG